MSHIVCLLLTLIFKHMPPLLEGGHVHIAKSPLYVVKRGGKAVSFLLDDEARADWELEMVGKKYDVARGTRRSEVPDDVLQDALRGWSLGYVKGLGELDPEDLAMTTLDRANRTLVRVTVEDAERAAEALRVLMDSNAVEPRKQFITERALEARLDV